MDDKFSSLDILDFKFGFIVYGFIDLLALMLEFWQVWHIHVILSPKDIYWQKLWDPYKFSWIVV